MIAFKIQRGFWEKWDGEGDPTGPVDWEDEDATYPTNEEARVVLMTMDRPELCRVRVVVTP